MSSSTIISIAILVLLICWSVGAYNRLVRLKNVISNVFGQVDVQHKRRYDLIPHLVEAAEKYLQHERDVLEAVISARKQALAASDAVRNRPATAKTVTALAVAEQALDNNLERLFALAAAYPELQADQIVQGLCDELKSTENPIIFARKAYNDAALDYNKARNQFPAMILARIFGFAPSTTL